VLRGKCRQSKSGEGCEQECFGQDSDVAFNHRFNAPGEPGPPGTQALLVKDTHCRLRMFRPFWLASRSATPAGNPLNPKPHTRIQPPSAPWLWPPPLSDQALAAAHREPIPPALICRAAEPGIA